MKITQVRHSTIIVEYVDKKFLIDPFLAERGTYGLCPFLEEREMNRHTKNIPQPRQQNPLVSLPMSIDKVIEGIDAVILTHLHLDHFDEVAQKILPKDVKMFVQNEEDAQEVRNVGFQNIEVLQAETKFEGIQLIKTQGKHGRRKKVLETTGLVCGVVFKHPIEKTLYVAGDTVWYEGVQQEIHTHRPDIIIVNGGDMQSCEAEGLTMGKEDIYEVYEVALNATIIPVHMNALANCVLSKEELKRFIQEKGLSSQILVPEDGESYTFRGKI